MIFADEFNPALLSSASAGQLFSHWSISPSMFVKKFWSVRYHNHQQLVCLKSPTVLHHITRGKSSSQPRILAQDAAAVPALGVESAKTKASNIKKKPKGAVPNKGGASIKPLYKEMVIDAIVTQKERLGSSLSAIKNHLISKYKIDVNQKAGALNR